MTAAALLLPAQGAPAVPDYVATVRRPQGAATVFHHAGHTRTDTPRYRGGTESRYEAPGQAAEVESERDKDGRPLDLFVQALRMPSVRPAPAWRPAGEQMTVATEACAVQAAERVGPVFAGEPVKRCVSADGVVLLSQPGFVATAVERRTVAPSEAFAPLQLMQLRSWLPADAFADDAGRLAQGDYEVELRSSAGGVRLKRRSGAWRSDRREDRGRTELRVSNADRAFDLLITGTERSLSLWIGRRDHDVFVSRPADVEGRAEEVVLGERCQWRSRPATPDSSDYECRTADGVLLAALSHGNAAWTPLFKAVRLHRAREPLSAVLPDPDLLSPGRYGLGAVGEGDPAAAGDHPDPQGQ